MSDSGERVAAVGRRNFATTRWSLVSAAADSDPGQARAALTALCEIYWFPLYYFVRRQGHEASEAEDLTQGFFARLLARDDWRTLSQEHGRFRSFLLASLKHFLCNEWDRQQAAKRGGGRRPLSLDFAAADSRCTWEPAAGRTPEEEFDRQWALALLARVRTKLGEQYAAAGKAPHFEALESLLTGERAEISYRELGERLDMSEGAVKVAVHRLRRRFGELLRQEIAQTLTADDQVDDELRSLLRALQS
jgi:RNA polymerase sigma factor (sigma-70 family)